MSSTNETPVPDEEPIYNQFVIVLAYESDEGELPDDFVKMAQDIKALFTLKTNMRMYAVVEESANNILALLEKPT